MNTKKGHTPKDAARKKLHLYNTDIRAQQQRLLKVIIKFGSVATLYTRDNFNIMSPAPRIVELKKQGHTIIPEQVTIRDENWCLHQGVANYVLIAQPGGEYESLQIRSD